MGDRRRTSLKLTEEAFAHLEEEQERRNLSTQQDTVEAIIRDNKQRRTSDADTEHEADPPLAAARTDLEENSTLLAVGGIAAAAVAFAVGGSAWVVTAAVFLAAAVAGTALRFRAYRAQERDGDSDGENAGGAPTADPRAGGG